MGVIIFFVIIFVIIGVVAAAATESVNEEEVKKLSKDIFIKECILKLVSIVTDLKNAPVSVLRTGGTFYLLFVEGSVYYEVRWTEGRGENMQKKKNTQ